MQFNLITIGSIPDPDKLQQFNEKLRVLPFDSYNKFLVNRTRLRTVHGFLLAADADPLIISEIRKSYPAAVVLVACGEEETTRAEVALRCGANDVLFSAPEKANNLSRIFIRLLQINGDNLKLAYSNEEANSGSPG